MMNYKEYTGRIVSIDEEQGIFHGEVADINDVVTFEGRNLTELIQAFHDSVDDYLAFCEEEEDTPEKPYSGKFLVRISPDLHRRAALAASKNASSLNAWVADAMSEHLRNTKKKAKHVVGPRQPQRRVKSSSKASR